MKMYSSTMGMSYADLLKLYWSIVLSIILQSVDRGVALTRRKDVLHDLLLKLVDELKGEGKW